MSKYGHYIRWRVVFCILWHFSFCVLWYFLFCVLRLLTGSSRSVRFVKNTFELWIHKLERYFTRTRDIIILREMSRVYINSSFVVCFTALFTSMHLFWNEYDCMNCCNGKLNALCAFCRATLLWVNTRNSNWKVQYKSLCVLNEMTFISNFGWLHVGCVFSLLIWSQNMNIRGDRVIANA